MLDDGEAEAGAAGFAATRCVHAVEAFGDARQMLARNAAPMVGDRQNEPGSLANRRNLNPRVLAIAAIAHRIAEEIVDHLNQLRAIAAKWRQAVGNFDDELTLAAGAHVGGV